MRGKVISLQNAEQLTVVLTEEGQRTLIDLLDSDCKVGDEICWAGGYPVGYETARNVTRGTSMHVYFQGHCAPQQQLRPLLLVPE